MYRSSELPIPQLKEGPCNAWSYKMARIITTSIYLRSDNAMYLEYILSMVLVQYVQFVIVIVMAIIGMHPWLHVAMHGSCSTIYASTIYS